MHDAQHNQMLQSGSSLNDLDLHSVYRIARRLELVQSCCCKWHERVQALAMVDYVREMTTEMSCKYDEYA